MIDIQRKVQDDGLPYGLCDSYEIYCRFKSEYRETLDTLISLGFLMGPGMYGENEFWPWVRVYPQGRKVAGNRKQVLSVDRCITIDGLVEILHKHSQQLHLYKRGARYGY